jgi:hypothetical protein
MNVFFDTEFTTSESHIGYPGLISIACIAEDGREFYAELTNTWQPGNCSQFVLDTVLPLLDGGDCRMLDAQCAQRLKYWIESLTDSLVIMRSDAPRYDWPWIEELFQFFGCWPNNLRRKCGSICFDNENQQQRFDNALKEYWRINQARRHHALVDARSLLYAWKQAIRRGF